VQASMYTLSVPVFKRMLGNLSAILEKAAAHAQQRGVDPAVLLASRLFPDMFPLTRQVQLACDFAKGAASRLAGQQPPKYEDNEASFQQLRARIERTIAFVDSIRPEQIDGSEQRQIELQLGGTTRRFDGLGYLAHVALPNFYFHVATAYAILRHNGVELGKRDFVGPG
jgi:uncharacterized protein